MVESFFLTHCGVQRLDSAGGGGVFPPRLYTDLICYGTGSTGGWSLHSCLNLGFLVGLSGRSPRGAPAWRLDPSLLETKVKVKGQDCRLNINFLSQAFVPASGFGFSAYLAELLIWHPWQAGLPGSTQLISLACLLLAS